MNLVEDFQTPGRVRNLGVDLDIESPESIPSTFVPQRANFVIFSGHAAEEDSNSPRRRYESVDTRSPSLFRRKDNEPWAIFGSWNPVLIFVIFCFVEFVFNFDGGCWAALLESIEIAVGLNNIEVGFTQMAYLFGFAFFSPVFGYLSTRTYPIKVIGFGICLWSVGTMCVSASNSFFSFVLFRTFAGIGNAAFKSTALTLIDLIAPPRRRGLWVAVFYSVSTSATAIGNIIGGQVADWSFINMYGWRFLFAMEVIVLFPICLTVSFFIPGPRNLTELDPISVPEVSSLYTNVKTILGNYLFLILVAGYSCAVFVRGQINFFVIAFLKHRFGIKESTGGLYFGVLTIISGFFAVNLGGIALDRLKAKINYAEDSLYIHTALSICLPLTTLAIPFVLTMYWMQQTLFLIFLFIAQNLLYAQIGPMFSSIMWCVPVSLRSLANAINMFFIHSLGDAISPVIAGALMEATTWTMGLFLCSLSLVFSCFFLWLSFKESKRLVQDFIGDDELDILGSYGVLQSTH